MQSFLTHILVPCDFREESYSALTYTSDLAEKAGAAITLLHLAAVGADLPAANTLMERWKSRLAKHFQGTIETIVREGDIMTDIGRVAASHQCELVVMPTHGMKGMQEITGSLALNVITESEIPFLIVQPNYVTEHTNVMVIPVEYRVQLMEEISTFVNLASLLKTEVHFHVNDRSDYERDPAFLKQLEDQFTSGGVKCRFIHVGKFDFSKATVEYAKTINAAIIAAPNFSYENLYSINPRTDEEDLIYNEARIPVLLVTPGNQDDDLAPSDYNGEAEE